MEVVPPVTTIDTFFSTKTAGKYSQINTCCQLFVIDKVFVYVVSMKSKSEILQGVKKFAKEIGVFDAIILYATVDKTSKELRKY